MKDAIAKIIDEIGAGNVFDSHYVISRLIKDYSDEYIHFATPKQNTKQMHGIIAQLIDDLPNTKQLGNNFYSENIHGKPSVCTYWEII